MSYQWNQQQQQQQQQSSASAAAWQQAQAMYSQHQTQPSLYNAWQTGSAQPSVQTASGMHQQQQSSQQQAAYYSQYTAAQQQQYYQQLQQQQQQQQQQQMPAYGTPEYAEMYRQNQAAWARYHAAQARAAQMQTKSNPTVASSTPTPQPTAIASTQFPQQQSQSYYQQAGSGTYASQNPYYDHNARSKVPSSEQPQRAYTAPAPSAANSRNNNSAGGIAGFQSWPPALRQYAQRSYATVRNDPVAKAAVTAELKRVMEEASRAGTLYSTDWQHQPLPAAARGGSAAVSAPTVSGTYSQSAPWLQPITRGRTGARIPSPAKSASSAWNNSAAMRQKQLQRMKNRDSSSKAPAGNIASNAPMLQRFSAGVGTVSASGRASGRYLPSKSRSRSRSRSTSRSRSRSQSRSRSPSQASQGSAAWTGKRPMGRKERRKMNRIKKKQQMEKLKQRKAKAIIAAPPKPEVQEPTTEQLWRTAGERAQLVLKPRSKISALQCGDSAIGASVVDSATAPKSVVGTCQVVEKNFYRLTEEPEPGDVRPAPVLAKALAHVCAQWWVDDSSGSDDAAPLKKRARRQRNRVQKPARCEYQYVWTQLKSVRQDLTCQNIRNALTVEVYESHARIAAEVGDMNEFNQCQTQLKQLYVQLNTAPSDNGTNADPPVSVLHGGAEGKDGLWIDEAPGVVGHPTEFLAYRLLYYVLTKSAGDLQRTMATLTPKQRRHRDVHIVLRARSLHARGDYRGFFQLLSTVSQEVNLSRTRASHLHHPHCSLVFLLRKFVHDMRQKAMRRIFKAYRPSVSVGFLRDTLHFSSTSECLAVLLDKGHEIEKDRLAVKLELESSVESSEPDENTRVQCKLSVPVMDKRLKLRVEEKFGYRGAKALHFT